LSISSSYTFGISEFKRPQAVRKVEERRSLSFNILPPLLAKERGIKGVRLKTINLIGLSKIRDCDKVSYIVKLYRLGHYKRPNGK